VADPAELCCKRCHRRSSCQIRVKDSIVGESVSSEALASRVVGRENTTHDRTSCEVNDRIAYYLLRLS
jgi:hypothetical protein